jgi:hypothetical protein
MGRRVWPHEIAGFLRDNHSRNGPTLAAFWGAPQDGEEEAMLTARGATDAGDSARRLAGVAMARQNYLGAEDEATRRGASSSRILRKQARLSRV